MKVQTLLARINKALADGETTMDSEVIVYVYNEQGQQLWASISDLSVMYDVIEDYDTAIELQADRIISLG